MVSLRVTRKRATTDCDRRIEEIRMAFGVGLKLKERGSDDLSDWGGG
jgi:hypothetical protein